MIWGAPNFCPKNDLMHWVLHKKSIGFSAQIKKCSPKEKKKKNDLHWNWDGFSPLVCPHITTICPNFRCFEPKGGATTPPPAPAFYGYVWDCCLCWNGLKSDLKHLGNIYLWGANLLKIKVTNQWKLRKMPKSKQSNLIADVKMPNISFINKYITNSEIRGKGGYSVLVNYPSLLSNIFPLAPQLFFFIQYKWNTLLRVSFIEYQNFVIYQHVNKKTTMVSLATSHIAH